MTKAVITKLNKALSYNEKAGIYADNEIATRYYSELVDILVRDAIELCKPALLDSLHQDGPLLRCVGCGHLLFDGREELVGDVVSDCADGPPVGFE